ncbi:hypothetical protein BDW74DRAFT_179984 [Aspergillus multicolor]|uniref:uncharacterized protein n=1 Tax=Aspergillus multicolor TaxID=41759 RepID=UPI003CCD865D
MNGTGANNFAGLCQFSCTYGYCPIGACTCTKMGIGYEPPNSTGVQGYPIAGEGTSYSGLCSFDCNLGYCPPNACGTEKVPLVIPTVSPFLPPACTSGTGEGNLAGLCDFSCTHGFCPINACTCTGQGAVNVMDPTTDVSGEAAPGQYPAIYGPLCEYTCQRGYCPEGACQEKSSGGNGSGSGKGNGDGDVYIAPSTWDDSSPVIQCEPPCSLILPPLPLDAPSTISIPPWSTPVTQSYLTTRTTTDPDGITSTILGFEQTTTTITLSFPTSVITEIPVWGVSINASQTKPSVIEMTSSITLPEMVYTMTRYTTGPNAASITTTITPPPYPWTETDKDTKLNTRTTTWSPGAAKPQRWQGRPGRRPALRAFLSYVPTLPSGLVLRKRRNTRTAQICSTACVEGSGCDFARETTTSCSATASSTSIQGTPAPGVAMTMEEWSPTTDDPQVMLSIATSLDKEASSKFGTQTVVSGIMPTGPAPSNDPYTDTGIYLYYLYRDRDTKDRGGVWKVGEFDDYTPGLSTGCDRDGGVDDRWQRTDRAFRGIKDRVTLEAWGDTCTCRRATLPSGNVPILQEKAGTLECDYYRDAVCYENYYDGGTCEAYQEWWMIMKCEW